MSLPTWLVQYATRRPTLAQPLTRRDYDEIEVGARDAEGAAASFRQRFPRYEIKSISPRSPLGFS